MKNPLTRKILMILGLTLLLCIPLRMVGVTVWERSSAREAVKADIANSMAGAQWVGGPVLVLPYRERVFTRTRDKDGQESVAVSWAGRVKVWLPTTLEIRGDLANKPRYRGIYEAQLYQSRLKMHAAFDLEKQPAPEGENIFWGRPYLALGIGDVRGISEMPRGAFNGDALVFEANPGLDAFGSGVHAPVTIAQGGHAEVAVDLELKGMEKLDFLPLGGSSTIILGSNWPHPSFQGRYLPDHSDIGKDGFSAKWRTTFLATNIEGQLQDCVQSRNEAGCNALRQNVMGVKLIKPVDVYLQSERALKYGFLFVGLAFVVFFFFEILKSLRIHPMQYLLVGLALTVFFLLVVALAEHVKFGVAYAIAAGGCSTLLAFYVSFVLKSFWRGMGFASLMGVLFGVLYGLLQSEDYALLMGSLLLFGVLAIVMILTRRLDWFSLGEATPSQGALQGGKG
ncbi:MAG: hypothetical protein K0R03_666 [Moraxellaceae bacterium]|jgi:inner membrane protein|nr:hypothetical protein [Moraxellaceae bacterium]